MLQVLQNCFEIESLSFIEFKKEIRSSKSNLCLIFLLRYILGSEKTPRQK